MDLIYDIGTKSRSAKVLRMLYGSSSFRFRSANLDTTFRFDCQQTGDCCRAGKRQANHIVGQLQIGKIIHHGSERGIKIRGLQLCPYRPALSLDGVREQPESLVSGKSVSKTTLVGRKGVEFVGADPSLDCQFLKEGKCSINPVKPILCKLSPMSVLFEHRQNGGRLILSIQPTCDECMTGKTWTVREWLETHTSEQELNEWINDMRREHRHLPLQIPR